MSRPDLPGSVPVLLSLLSVRFRRRLPDQAQFIFPFHLFDLPFPAQRFMPVRVGFMVYHLNRQTRPCIPGAFSLVMLPESALEVCRPSAVKRTVRTSQNIDIIHQPITATLRLMQLFLSLIILLHYAILFSTRFKGVRSL